MKNPRLRLDRIAKRSIAEVRKKEKTAPAQAPEKSIKAEAADETAKRTKRLSCGGSEYGTSLLDLFNVEMVDFVKKTGESVYVPVEWPSQATHQLVPTSWNKDDESPNAPSFALSVCANPLRRRIRQTSVVVRKPFPKNSPGYDPKGSINGKRNVLRFLVIATKAKIPKTLVDKMKSDELDMLYEAIIRASRALKKSRKKS